MEAEMHQETLDFWRGQLAGAIPWLSLPKDRKVTRSAQPVVQRWDMQVDTELAGGLEDLACKHNVATTTVLLAAFQVLLFRYTGWRDLVVACPDRDCLDGALPVRILLSEDKSSVDLLKELEATLRQIAGHRDIPASLWRELMRAESGERRLLPSPVWFTAAVADVDSASITGGVSGTEKSISQGELSLAISKGETGLCAHFQYNAELFQAATIQWMSRHYHQLLRHVVCRPETKLDDLPLETPEELTIVRQWSYGEPAPAHDRLYHELFQALVERKPDAPAVVYEGTHLTYGDLERRANQLAHHLQTLGVGPDVVVGLLMECSPELVIATLAAFKAGGAVFFLPPASPPARLSSLLKLGAPQVVVTRKPFSKLLREACLHVVCLDESDACLAGCPGTAPPNRATGENLGFLFLTSGSTGKPKIVMEPLGFRSQLRDESTERFILKSNTGTSFTAAEIMAIILGGILFIVPEGTERDIRKLASFVGDHQITYLILVPSALGALLSLDDLSSCSSLRTVHCIGEMITPALKRRFFERLHARLLIGYECTETRGATSR
jgi:non-ribosomal peptide synthetase component F